MLRFLSVAVWLSVLLLLVLTIMTVMNVNATYSELKRILIGVDSNSVRIEIHTNQGLLDFNKLDWIEED